MHQLEIKAASLWECIFSLKERTWKNPTAHHEFCQSSVVHHVPCSIISITTYHGQQSAVNYTDNQTLFLQTSCFSLNRPAILRPRLHLFVTYRTSPLRKVLHQVYSLTRAALSLLGFAQGSRWDQYIYRVLVHPAGRFASWRNATW